MIYHWDKTKPMMIDFEYSKVNLRGTDLASFCNEATMDLTHPYSPFYKVYPEFNLSMREQEFAMLVYLKRYYKCHMPEEQKLEISREHFLQNELPILKKQVAACRMLQDAQWAVWTINMLPESELEKPSFYAHYCIDRMKMFKQKKEKYVQLYLSK